MTYCVKLFNVAKNATTTTDMYLTIDDAERVAARRAFYDPDIDHLYYVDYCCD